MRTVVEVNTRRNPAEGLALLGEDLWLASSNFHNGVGGYLAGLPGGSNWRAVRDELHELLPGREARLAAAGQGDVNPGTVEDALDLAVARRWSRSDLDAAVQWYSYELTSDGWIANPTGRTVQVLQTIPVSEWSFVSNWMTTRQTTDPQWDDQVVVQFLRSKNEVTPNADLGRLVALPARVDDRADIVAAFATPLDRKGVPVLRHPADALVALIEAAQLPAADAEHWLRTVAEAHPGS